jgi:hypothetical protein
VPRFMATNGMPQLPYSLTPQRNSATPANAGARDAGWCGGTPSSRPRFVVLRLRGPGRGAARGKAGKTAPEIGVAC